MPDLLAHLNPQQLAAVTLPAQHALILAGAGSGKTRVLTTRLAWLISTGQVSAAAVLAVTFTNKAAKEMLARISAMLPINTRGMWVGTFHGLCNRFLRTHYQDAALPQSFQILDSQDQLAAIKRLLRALNVDDEKFPPRNVQHFINGEKEEGRRPDAAEVVDDYSARMVSFYRAYDDQCQREGVVDFAELLLRSYELLQRNQLLREHYQARFRHILVDEFQDTNDLQYRWLRLLAGPQTTLFAVGDDDQSIYAFRGANVGNMAAFERDYARENLIKLEQNYRSHAHILNTANHLIRQNRHRLGKDLWTDAGEGEPVRIYESLTDSEEAQWLLEEIRSLIGQGSLRSEIAILYRSNAQSRILEHALFSAGIPYRVYGGLRFFERAEVKHALAYLRLLENADDDSAFLRVVNLPARGIGARTMESLQDLARARGISLYRAAAFAQGGASGKLAQFVGLIERLRRQAQGLPLTDAIDLVLEASGLITFYQSEREGQDRIENLRELVNAAAAYLNENGIDRSVPASVGLSQAASAGDRGARGETVQAGTSDAEGEAQAAAEAAAAAEGEAASERDAADAESPEIKRIGQVEVIGADELVDADGAPIAPGVSQIALSPLAGFLAHASLESGERQAGEGTDSIQMMTVHAAKGLEFSAVFVTGLEEGLFPHENAAAQDDGLEEERRLMYVAITRARERLYMSFSQTRLLHGQTRYNLKSRFLDELPEQDLKWLTARGRRGGYESYGGYSGGQSGGGQGGFGRFGGAGGGYSPRQVATRATDYAGSSPWREAGNNPTRSAPRDARFRIGQGVAHAR
ncbi:MAG TPA: UvrD-helicase domain-containing protein, partial [Lautropia sp.]|nr:UvrD-helicase domain-containing protein [Lautropia sp.]